MKIVALIFALYVAALHVLPCVDEVPHMAVCTADFTQGTHHHGGDEADACSPFCVCSCCNVIMMMSSFIFADRPQWNATTTLVDHYRSYISSFVTSFWQPPKIKE